MPRSPAGPIGIAVRGHLRAARTGSRPVAAVAATAVCGLFGLAAPPAATGQVTAADYARAERFLPWNAEALLRNAGVTPHWVDGGPRFWYRADRPDGRAEYLLVDPVEPGRRPLFDHARFAAALAAAADHSVDADRLPVESLVVAGAEARFRAFDAPWRCDLSSYRCEPAPGPPAGATEVVSPDGERAVLQRDGDLWVRHLDTGEERRLTRDGEPHFGYGLRAGANQATATWRRLGTEVPPVVLWSPDSRRILTHRLDERHVPELWLVQAAPPGGGARPRMFPYRMPFPGDTAAFAELLVLDVESGRRVAVDYSPLPIVLAGPIELDLAWWGVDARTVYFIEQERGLDHLRLNAVDAATGSVRRILEESSPTFAELTVDYYDGTPNVRMLGDGAEFIWFSERDGWGHLYLYDGATGRLENRITSGDWVVRSIVHVDETARRVFFTAGGREPGRDPYYRHLYSVGLDGSDLRLLTPEDAEHEVWFAPGGGYFVDRYSRVDTAPVTVVRAADGRLVMELERADLSGLLALGWKPPEPFRARAADGVTDVYGLIHWPSRFDPTRTYPVIDAVYPGPQVARTPKSLPFRHWLYSGWFWNAQAVAELGFIVVNVDGRGTPLRSKAFHDHAFGNLGSAGGIEDHVAAIRQLAAERPYMDLGRVGVYGHSAGGFAAARAMLLHPDFYKVGVSSAGYMSPRAGQAYWSEKYQGYPVTDAAYAGHDNMALAHRLRGELLIAYGELDENVDPVMVRQFIDALVQARRRFDVLVLPNRAHGFARDPYFVQRLWDYFVEHLLDSELPDHTVAGPEGTAAGNP